MALRKGRHAHACDSNVARVTVTESSDGSSIVIALPLGNSMRRFDRSKEEPLERSMRRIRMEAIRSNCMREKEDVALLEHIGSHTQIGWDTPNAAAWQPGRVLLLGDEELLIHFNPPTVDKIHMHARPTVGLPLCAAVELRYAEREACQWRWYRTLPAPKVHRKKRDEQVSHPKIQLDWNEAIYVPCEADIGHLITVECIPGSSLPGVEMGEAVSYTCAAPVQSNPAIPYAWKARQAETSSVLHIPQFRVVTYNVLSANYSSTDQAEKVLYPYCNREYLAVDYRKQLVYKELEGFNADIICLQEVDQKVFADYYAPMLQEKGFCGLFKGKSGTVLEGCALFFRESKFELVEYRPLNLKQLFKLALEGALDYDWVRDFLNQRTALTDVVCNKVTTIAQIAMLRPKQNHSISPPLCVVNTHLFFHSLAPHIRMMQIKAILQEAGKLIVEQEEQLGKKPVLIVCGDLNSQPCTGLIQLMKNGYVHETHKDWKRGTHFSWYTGMDEPWEGSSNRSSDDSEDDEEEEISHGMRLTIPFHLKSAGEDKISYSNFVGGENEFVGLLDYVFYEPERLEMVAVAPVLDMEELRRDKGLPSARFPSDHISLAFDFEFRACGTPHPLPATLSNVSLAVDALLSESIVAVPTDTLYGLAGKADSSVAVGKIYDIKRRSKSVPLAICVGKVSDIGKYGDVSSLPPGLLEDLLPGMITVLLHPVPGKQLCEKVNQGFETIGIRVPGSPFICQVADQLGGALALTSANVSGTGNTVEVHEFEELWPSCTYVFDGGRIDGGGKGSTVIDLSQAGKFGIIRDGEVLDQVLSIVQGKYGLVRSK